MATRQVQGNLPDDVASGKRVLKIDSRLEWLVIASILVLIALALALGWIDIDWPRRL